MEPKLVQDIAPPSGPEMVGDIPVRAPSGQSTTYEKPVESNDDDSSFIVSNNRPETKKPAAPLSIAYKKDQGQPKNSKPKPTLAIVILLLALICLAAGAYLKYFTNT